MELSRRRWLSQAPIPRWPVRLAFVPLHAAAHEFDEDRPQIGRVPGLPMVRRWRVVHPRNHLLPPIPETLR